MLALANENKALINSDIDHFNDEDVEDKEDVFDLGLFAMLSPLRRAPLAMIDLRI